MRSNAEKIRSDVEALGNHALSPSFCGHAKDVVVEIGYGRHIGRSVCIRVRDQSWMIVRTPRSTLGGEARLFWRRCVSPWCSESGNVGVQPLCVSCFCRYDAIKLMIKPEYAMIFSSIGGLLRKVTLGSFFLACTRAAALVAVL